MSLSHSTTSHAPVLKIQDASVVQNGKALVRHLNLEITEGRHTAILGPNGSGKSTLIKLITRQYYPFVTDGENSSVSIFGHDRWNVFELRALLGIVSADLHQTFTGEGAVSGLEAVLSGFFASQGLARHHGVTAAMRNKAQEALAQVEATHLSGKRLDQMSTGEARRMLIARALVSEPRALLLDEPTTGLDIAARRRFLETLRRLARQGKTIILVTHHVEEIIPEIERLVLMRDGTIFREGDKRDLLTPDTLTLLFDAPISVQGNDGYYSAEVQSETR